MGVFNGSSGSTAIFILTHWAESHSHLVMASTPCKLWRTGPFSWCPQISLNKKRPYMSKYNQWCVYKLYLQALSLA
jgi:hypothetical protein